MSMRTYRPIRLAAFPDEQTRRELQGVDDWLRQLSANQTRLVQMPQGTPSAVTNPSTDINTGVFLYLPGRSFEQKSLGPVSFDAFGLPYSSGTVPTTENTFSWRALTSDLSAQPARVFIGVQGSSSTATAAPQKRHWVFPSFTEINGGPSTGLHAFVDQSDFQTLSKKTFNNDCFYSLEDTTRPSGWMNATRNRLLSHAWGGGWPVGGYASEATRTTPTGVIPSVQFPGLDYKDNGAGALDRTHCWAIVKRDHTFSSGNGRPFEPGGLLYGSSSGAELYPMFTTAQGTLAAPAAGSFPIWQPFVSQSCTFTFLSAIVTMASTTGIQVGMRLRETINNYSLSEDTHVKSVDSPTQITINQVWPGPNSAHTIEFFGLTWSDTATSITLGAGALTNYLYLPGRTGGQYIGAGTKPTSGGIDDLATYGRLYIGSSVAEADAFVSGTKISLKQDFDATVLTGFTNMFRNLINITGTGTGAAGTFSGYRLDVSGGSGITAGSYALMGFQMLVNPTVSAGASASITGLVFSSQPVGAGTFTLVAGADITAGLSGAGGTCTTLIGIRVGINNVATVTTNAIAYQASNIGGFAITAAVTQATAYDIGPTFMNDTDVVTWSGFRCSTGLTAAIANKWCLDLTNTSTNMKSRVAHPIALGWNPATVSAITARLMLSAGAAGASAAPLKFQSGTLQTTAEAGAMEFLTDDFYLTISTGAARKKIVLDDGTALTAGRVPFAGTNGRLVDDADLTFATDTLTATKLVISQGAIVSGVYTPTLTNVANLDATTAYQCQYMRVGNVVTVSGKLDADPTLTVTATQVGISLPIASNFGAEQDCGGAASSKTIAGQSAGIFADAVNDQAQMEWKSGDVTNQAMYFTFTYRII